MSSPERRFKRLCSRSIKLASADQSIFVPSSSPSIYAKKQLPVHEISSDAEDLPPLPSILPSIGSTLSSLGDLHQLSLAPPSSPPSTAASNEFDEALEFFNTASDSSFQERTFATRDQYELVVQQRPFFSVEDLRRKLSSIKGGVRGLWDKYLDLARGYDLIDELILQGNLVSAKVAQATLSSDPTLQLNLENVQLKPFQQLGVNWLKILFCNASGAILADEMGLGKTVQVIVFLHELLKSASPLKPPPKHLIIVPASTIDNWQSEFIKFTPEINVVKYYGTMQERDWRREEIKTNPSISVILTTYNIAIGAKEDRSFLRRLSCETIILDEGHMIKNYASQRHQHLLTLASRSKFRLILTGTPLQNNLQELCALLTFILPDLFANNEESLRKLFKVPRTDGATVEKLKKMLAPFMLRRLKKEVLKELPNKKEILIKCDLHPLQASLYQKCYEEMEQEYLKKESSPAGILSFIMKLRKLASHSLLKRHVYDDQKVWKLCKELLKELEYADQDPNELYEDLSMMTDIELHRLSMRYKRLSKFTLNNDEWMRSGKIIRLLEIVKSCCKEKKEKMLIFSQFVSVLDILELVLTKNAVTFVRLDGSTPVNDRGELIAQYNADPDLMVFLLSTKAGGFGINLASANVVVIHDVDFNPQNDRQAEDRAHRVGQKKEVTVYRLVSKQTIEEQIHQVATKKLGLEHSFTTAAANTGITGTTGEVESTPTLSGICFNQQREGVEQ